MFCVVLSLACPHPRAIKPMALITYHSIQRAGKAIISGVESKVHGMGITGQSYTAGGTEVPPNPQV